MKKLIVILSLVLSLALCAGALAEQTSAADSAETAQVVTVAEQDFMRAAVDAYKALKKAAKITKKLDALKEELDAYVADGKLTQEQADLVLKYYTEKLTSNGTKDAKKETRKETRKEQTNGQTNGKGQQRQKTQTQNGKGSTSAKPTDNGASGVDTASGATKKGK